MRVGGRRGRGARDRGLISGRAVGGTVFSIGEVDLRVAARHTGSIGVEVASGLLRSAALQTMESWNHSDAVLTVVKSAFQNVIEGGGLEENPLRKISHFLKLVVPSHSWGERCMFKT